MEKTEDMSGTHNVKVSLSLLLTITERKVVWWKTKERPRKTKHLKRKHYDAISERMTMLSWTYPMTRNYSDRYYYLHSMLSMLSTFHTSLKVTIMHGYIGLDVVMLGWNAWPASKVYEMNEICRWITCTKSTASVSRFQKFALSFPMEGSPPTGWYWTLYDVTHCV